MGDLHTDRKDCRSEDIVCNRSIVKSLIAVASRTKNVSSVSVQYESSENEKSLLTVVSIDGELKRDVSESVKIENPEVYVQPDRGYYSLCFAIH